MADHQTWDGIERRTGEKGGAYIGEKWFSAEELRANGRRITDGMDRSKGNSK